MPTYEYLCESCEYAFEKFQGINEDPIKECPRCGGKVRKLISGGAGLIFKGSGFYITDYKKKEGKNGKGTSTTKKGEEKNG
ncbi:MAG: zinc ribbon domain-containing protein [Caldiserica bacterium]|nr:zinc ribbon domain-containing protein [Caldisericota bacterium]